MAQNGHFLSKFLSFFCCSLCSLFSWRYKRLGNLPHTYRMPAFLTANAGFAFDYQLINVEDFNGVGESEPSAHFVQVCLWSIFSLWFSWSTHVSIRRLIDWSIDRWSRSNDWAIDWISDWVSDWLIEWVSEWSIDRLIDWSLTLLVYFAELGGGGVRGGYLYVHASAGLPRRVHHHPGRV